MSRILTYREALREGLDEELARDPNVVLMGEEVAQYNGAYKVTEGLWKKWGDKRVVDTPISEAGFIGMGIGASMLGVRPVMELMFWSFHSVAFDQLVSNAACVRYMSGGLCNCPIVVRGPANGGTGVGATHSHIPEGLFAAFPGLKVCAPATPADVKGLIKAAIRDNDPVYVMENTLLYGTTGEVPDQADGDFVIPLGLADINSQDIERVEVIKGAAASSLYGSDAANGVVQIFTKRGAALAAGQTSVTVRNEYGSNDLRKTVPNNLSHPYKVTATGEFARDANGNRIQEDDRISDNSYPVVYDQLDLALARGRRRLAGREIGEDAATLPGLAISLRHKQLGVLVAPPLALAGDRGELLGDDALLVGQTYVCEVSEHPALLPCHVEFTVQSQPASVALTLERAPAAISRASELTVTNWKPLAMRFKAASGVAL